MGWYQDTNYAIGLSPLKLVTLRSMDIAPPDQVLYQDATQYYVRSDMSRVGDGFSILTWIWDTMSYVRVANLARFAAGQHSAMVYVRSQMRDGTIARADQSFNVFYGTMWVPFLFGQEGTPVAKSNRVYNTVQFKFVDVVLQTGYL